MQDLAQKLAPNITSDHNTQDGVRSSLPGPSGSNGPDGPQPHHSPEGTPSQASSISAPRSKHGTEVSCRASNIFFNDNQNEHTNAPPKCHDKEQDYWQEILKEYAEESEYGAEISSSSIASASKIFWEKPMKKEVYEGKIEKRLIPANCPFLSAKRTNPEIWPTISGTNRTYEVKLQNIQKLHASSVTYMLQSASELTKILASTADKDIDIKKPLTMLKDSLSLAGKLIQSLNQFRRDIIKHALPPQYAKLADLDDDSSKYLFGESISDKVDILEKENKLRSLLKDSKPKYNKNSSYKRPHTDSSNYQSSSKTLKRTYNQGQTYQDQHYHQKPHFQGQQYQGAPTYQQGQSYQKKEYKNHKNQNSNYQKKPRQKYKQ